MPAIVMLYHHVDEQRGFQDDGQLAELELWATEQVTRDALWR